MKISTGRIVTLDVTRPAVKTSRVLFPAYFLCFSPSSSNSGKPNP